MQIHVHAKEFPTSFKQTIRLALGAFCCSRYTINQIQKLIFHNPLNTFCPFQREMDFKVASNNFLLNAIQNIFCKNIYCKGTYGTISILVVQLCHRSDLLPLVLKFQKEK